MVKAETTEVSVRIRWSWQRLGVVGLAKVDQNKDRLWIPYLVWNREDVQRPRRFGRPRDNMFRLDRPGVYRFQELDMEGQVVAAYVGESQSINSRLANYARPTRPADPINPSTDARIHAWVHDAVVGGTTVEVHAAYEARMQVEDGPEVVLELAGEAARRVIEQAEESRLRGTGIRVLNHSRTR